MQNIKFKIIMDENENVDVENLRFDRILSAKLYKHLNDDQMEARPEDEMEDQLEDELEDPPLNTLLKSIYYIPAVIFIVPYRDRANEMVFFKEKMTKIMEDYPHGYYKIYYIQQNHEKPFNRGAMKNIGFLMVKSKYPTHYKNITLVFNDLDTVPTTKTTIPNYCTTRGIIKHFYGYKHALGGIVSILAGDFETVNGFPNYYSWGFEDNELSDRILKNKMFIDRSVFYHIRDDINILQLKDTPYRITNKGEYDRFLRKVEEGINTIYDLSFTTNDITGIVDVTHFKTKHNVNEKLNFIHDGRINNIPFKTGYSAKKRCKINMLI